jgi:hypothetical protein
MFTKTKFTLLSSYESLHQTVHCSLRGRMPKYFTKNKFIRPSYLKKNSQEFQTPKLMTLLNLNSILFVKMDPLLYLWLVQFKLFFCFYVSQSTTRSSAWLYSCSSRHVQVYAHQPHTYSPASQASQATDAS